MNNISKNHPTLVMKLSIPIVLDIPDSIEGFGSEFGANPRQIELGRADSAFLITSGGRLLYC